MKEAIQIYKELFEPSDVLDKPYMIVCLNVIVAESDEEAEYLASTLAQVLLVLLVVECNQYNHLQMTYKLF